MKPNSFSLSSHFEMPSRLATVEATVGDFTVRTSSPCLGRAALVTGEIEKALEEGAVPLAQLVIASRVRTAKQDAVPLECSLTFCG